MTALLRQQKQNTLAISSILKNLANLKGFLKNRNRFLKWKILANRETLCKFSKTKPQAQKISQSQSRYLCEQKIKNKNSKLLEPYTKIAMDDEKTNMGQIKFQKVKKN